MRFDVAQRFARPVDEVVAVYADPAFHESLDGLGRIGSPDVLDHRVDRRTNGDVVHLAVRWRFTGDLPSAALAIVTPDRLTWVERTELDVDARTSRSVIAPDHYPDRLSAHATARFAVTGTGSTRTSIGELKVRALLVGGQVERAIVSGIREHLALEAEAAERWTLP